MCVSSDYGFYKVEAKTKTSSGVEFTTNGSSNHESKKFTGNLETKYKWSEYGTSPYGILRTVKTNIK